MTNSVSKCDSERLRLLLADQLSESIQAEVTDHIAACSTCRQMLESLAGDAEWWSEVETCFKANSDSNVSAADDVPPTVEDGHDTDGSFAADFAVGFLEPCDRSDAIGRLGEYEIVEVIGHGGMGVVLKGFHRELGRFVAVKVMAPHLATSGAARQRFVREARAAAAIVHPNVMPIHSVCTSTRLPYLVMPFIACESLQQRIDRQGPLDLKEILRIGNQVASGLAAAHAQGLIHRDIKPANILLEKGVDRVMLTDFGLARAADDGSLTRTGIITGTPQYMSPEQAQGELMDARSDLFSLGSVLYAMSTGRPPFRAETSLGILRRISDSRPRPCREINADLPDWLEQIIQRLHAKQPDGRIQSSSEVADLLEHCLAHVQQPIVCRLPESLHSRSVFRPSHRVQSALRWVVGILTIAIVGVVAWQWKAPQPIASNGPHVASPQSSVTVNDLTDEAVSRQSNEFQNDLDQFERRVLLPWDDSEPLDSLPNTTRTDSKPEQEKGQ